MRKTKPLSLFLILAFTLGCATSSHDNPSRENEKKGQGAKNSETSPPLTRMLVTSTFPDHSISALVQHFEQHLPFKRLILLMPGHPGIMKIESTEKYNLRQNFLILAGSAWLDSETITAAIDAPSDQWNSFSGSFRKSERYAEDLRGIKGELEKKFGPLQVTIIGTSEGSISAYHALQALKEPNAKLVLTSTLYRSTKNSHGLNSLDMNAIRAPVLLVHNEKDGCPSCPYRDAKELSHKMNWPLITVRTRESGPGDVCRARSRHQYWGAEALTAKAILSWIISGVVADVEER